MGKGAGCGQSKTSVPDQKLTEEVVKAPVAAEKEVVETKAKTTPSGKMTKKIYIVFYSTYGHIYKLAQTIKEGIDSVDGVEGILYQVRKEEKEKKCPVKECSPSQILHALNSIACYHLLLMCFVWSSFGWFPSDQFLSPSSWLEK